MAASVEGDIKVGGTFTQAKTSRWVGKVEATNAVVAGQVHGNVVVAEKLEVRKSASIRGSVRARTIAVAEGAVIEGEMVVTSSTPVIHFEEKRREN